MYQQVSKVLSKFFLPHQIFRYGFNLSPMYRRSGGRVKAVSPDMHVVKIEIPLNYKNRNYVGSMFGGSMLSATDPIYMIQLIGILGEEYVVWDKAATIRYKRPARERVYATFELTKDEIEDIKVRISLDHEIDIVKHLNLVSQEGKVFAELDKTLYVASKAYYKKKREKKAKNN
jgi:acyl-coenzyme A thioesterase PaaI-like protein